MELEGERRIPLSRSQVWAALNDPDVLRACIPGCRSLEKTSETSFAARVTSKIGPVSAAFSGTVALSDILPGEAYTISGHGQGGVAGFAKGGARVTLADDGEAGTRLAYKAEAEIGGKLASVGGRLLEAAARKTADQFFDAFVARLGGGEASTSEASGAAEVASQATLAPCQTPASLPGTLRIEVGEIRIVHQLSPMAFVTVAGWILAAVVLLWRVAH